MRWCPWPRKLPHTLPLCLMSSQWQAFPCKPSYKIIHNKDVMKWLEANFTRWSALVNQMSTLKWNWHFFDITKVLAWGAKLTSSALASAGAATVPYNSTKCKLSTLQHSNNTMTSNLSPYHLRHILAPCLCTCTTFNMSQGVTHWSWHHWAPCRDSHFQRPRASQVQTAPTC